MAHGVRRPAWRSSAVYAWTHGSSAMLPYGAPTPYHHAGVDREKRERVAVAQLKYYARCQATKWPVSPPRWLRVVVNWTAVGSSESDAPMAGGDVKM